uniref:UFSP1/2/DUB catalytic domain-containing protein n=1 Tax=Chrysotila carterae TaxID=13221 RepID=A0A6S9SDF4_CHRCT
MGELNHETHGSFGWLLGVLDGDEVLVLGECRCLHMTDSVPEWSREAAVVRALCVPCVGVVGFYMLCVSADCEAEVGRFVQKHREPLTRMLASDVCASAHGVAVTALKLDGAPTELRATLSAAVDVSAAARPPRSEAARRFREAFVGLRARATLSLQAVCSADSAGPQWMSSLRDGCQKLAEQIASPELHYFAADAPHLGLLSPRTPKQLTCASLRGTDCPNATGDGDAEDDDEHEGGAGGGHEVGAGGGARSKGKSAKAKKGGKKSGGGKPRRGGATEAIDTATTRTLEDLSTREIFALDLAWLASAPLSEHVVWPAAELSPSRPDETRAWPILLDTLVFARTDDAIASALLLLRAKLLEQLSEVSKAMATAATDAAAAASLRPTACVLRPTPHAPPVCVVYLLRDKEDESEPSCLQQREALHARLCLPNDRPLLRTSFALGVAARGSDARIPGLLRNVHVGLGASGVKQGTPALVQGSYEYYHYLQWTGHGQLPKPYDDNGWGCAYRSLMSIISWFRLQGYTAVLNPTHYEIQKRLVEHCGQSADELLGKKQWLGSQDVALFLENALGVTCKILECPSGDDVAGSARALVHHFETQGTPVMIGGGELAFTLLGVDFNPDSGDVRFLIMDPHYVGPDDLAQIHPKWVGWKSADSPTHLGTKLFSSDKFYNLCLPQRPSSI